MKEKEIDFWDELSAEQRESVRQARQELAEGKGIPHEDVKKEYYKYLNK